jgi:hypothetical protein
MTGGVKRELPVELAQEVRRQTPRVAFRWPAALAASLVLGLAPVARAQMVGSHPLPGTGRPQGAAAAPAAPAALPGARSDSAVAPAEVSPSSMNPTAALFDAINRDDIAAARDALNRGAELQAHNVLGMSPLQLSIDLGRNDITFLLLSERGSGDAGSAPPPGAAAAAHGLPIGHQAAAATPAPKRPGRAVAARTRSDRAHAAALPSPTRIAGNGGTPVPSAGFLGFDPGR